MTYLQNSSQAKSLGKLQFETTGSSISPSPGWMTVGEKRRRFDAEMLASHDLGILPENKLSCNTILV